jgi:methionyl-tRNA synthetase
VGALYNACKFRAALGEALALAWEANGYLDRKVPWFQIKEDKAAAATTVYVTRSVRVVDNLKTILAPVLPHTAQQLHEYLGYDGQPFDSAQGRLLWYPACRRVRGGDPLAQRPDLRPQQGHRHLDAQRLPPGHPQGMRS